MADLSRRIFIAAGLAGAACSGAQSPAPVAHAEPPVAAMKRVAKIPVGCAIGTPDLTDEQIVGLIRSNFSQFTPGWEFKMNAIVGKDAVFRFGNADKLADFASQESLALHGHALVWHKHEPPAFTQLSSDTAAFAALYKRYVLDVVTRYRGRVRAWDVVNEPLTHDGSGLRACLWSRMLGDTDYMVRAFDHAAEASPETPRFINEYDLEQPGKRAVFMRLVEDLLRRGALIDGIGTQTHIDVGLPTGALTETLKDLASFGLPVHISELDISLGRSRLDIASREKKLATQTGLASELATALMSLPPEQRYGLTLWGVRDRESWLRQPPFPPNKDEPLAFDDDGRPKPMLFAIQDVLAAV